MLYLGGGGIPHCQDISPNTKRKEKRKTTRPYRKSPEPHQKPPDPRRLVYALDRQVASFWLLVVATASHARPHHTLLHVRHLEGSISNNAGGHDVLLHQADEKHERRTSVDGVRKQYAEPQLTIL